MALACLIRARYALGFSARTALELRYGYDDSATTTFRVITIIESALAKLIFALALLPIR